MLSSLLANPGKHVVFLSADEQAWMVAQKLWAYATGKSVDDYVSASVESRQRALARYYPKLTVVGISDVERWSLDVVIEEVQMSEVEHGPVDAVFFDYSLLLDGEDMEGDIRVGAKSRLRSLKWLAHEMDDAVWVIGHQTNRKAVDGNCTGLSMAHFDSGGEQDVDGVIIGARRRLASEYLRWGKGEKREEIKAKLEEDPTVMVSIVKNKINGKLTKIEGEKMSIDKTSGRVTDYHFQGWVPQGYQLGEF